jgi:hypothetical protein
MKGQRNLIGAAPARRNKTDWHGPGDDQITIIACQKGGTAVQRPARPATQLRIGSGQAAAVIE